jgi:hypothetical protein
VDRTLYIQHFFKCDPQQNTSQFSFFPKPFSKPKTLLKTLPNQPKFLECITPNVHFFWAHQGKLFYWCPNKCREGVDTSGMSTNFTKFKNVC